MPQLIKSVIDLSMDSLATSVLNTENRTDILYTMPGVSAHSTNPEDIAYSIDYFLKSLDKKIIFLSDYKEAPNSVFLPIMKSIIEILIEKYHYNYSQMVYVSGFLPTIDNFEKLNKTYSEFSIPLIKNLNVFYFEEEWKKVINTCESYPNFIDLSCLHSRSLRSKKFLYFMGSARPHRVAILSFFIEQNYIKDCYYSCLSSKEAVCATSSGCTWHEERNKKFNFSEIDTILRNFNQNFPKELSSKLGDNPTQHSVTREDIYYFKDSYYSVIPETSYFKKDDNKNTKDQWNFHLDFTFITEKTMRAIAYLHPFVLLSRPHSLKGLRELGYQTFHPYIDESYDSIEDDHLRFESIKNTIKKLNNKTDSEWIRFQHDIYPIVKHNHDWLRADKNRKISYSPSAI
jgi:hypothetical protein